MQNQSHRKVLLIMFLWLLAPPFSSPAIDPVIDRATLRGIKSVYVTVSGLGTKIQREGLTAEEIQKDVIEKLGTAGIKVLTRERFMNSRGAPWLRVAFEKLSQNQDSRLLVQGFVVTSALGTLDATWAAVLTGAVADRLVGSAPQLAQQVKALLRDAHTPWESIVDEHQRRPRVRVVRC